MDTLTAPVPDMPQVTPLPVSEGLSVREAKRQAVISGATFEATLADPSIRSGKPVDSELQHPEVRRFETALDRTIRDEIIGQPEERGKIAKLGHNILKRALDYMTDKDNDMHERYYNEQMAKKARRQSR